MSRWDTVDMKITKSMNFDSLGTFTALHGTQHYNNQLPSSCMVFKVHTSQTNIPADRKTRTHMASLESLPIDTLMIQNPHLFTLYDSTQRLRGLLSFCLQDALVDHIWESNPDLLLSCWRLVRSVFGHKTLLTNGHIRREVPAELLSPRNRQRR